MSESRRLSVALTALILVGLVSALPAFPARASAGQEGKSEEGLGIRHAEKMILQLTALEQDKLKGILRDKLVEEAKSFVVTRYFMGLLKANRDLKNVKLDEGDRKNILQYFDIDYCADMNEDIDAMNGLLYFGIDPVKGVQSKARK